MQFRRLMMKYEVYGLNQNMANPKFYYSAATDLWSSVTMEPYLSYTVYKIDDD